MCCIVLRHLLFRMKPGLEDLHCSAHTQHQNGWCASGITLRIMYGKKVLLEIKLIWRDMCVPSIGTAVHTVDCYISMICICG